MGLDESKASSYLDFFYNNFFHVETKKSNGKEENIELIERDLLIKILKIQNLFNKRFNVVKEVHEAFEILR